MLCWYRTLFSRIFVKKGSSIILFVIKSYFGIVILWFLSVCLNLDRFVCPPGSSKPNAPTNACPSGTLSNRTDLTDRSQCQQCPARYACLRGAICLLHMFSWLLSALILFNSIQRHEFRSLYAILFMLYQELVVSRDPHSPALQDIIVHLEPCSPHSTSVLWGHGVVAVDWKLKASVSCVHRAGTVWLGLELRLVDAALDTTVLKVGTVGSI